MPPTILGLDIGGANIKAATVEKQAMTVPFALWKEPDRLSAVLADVVAGFEGIEGFAVTMTGELCDCFETRREGVNRILDAVLRVCRSWPVGVWGTNGKFVNIEEARRNHMLVASANWHALATFAGGYVTQGPSILIDIGSTTTDIVPIQAGIPVPKGRTDSDRMEASELVYTGVRRTPVCSLGSSKLAAELFATTLDVYLVLGMIPESEADTDTADGRPATRSHAHARLARMLGGDTVTITEQQTESLARVLFDRQIDQLHMAHTLVRNNLMHRFTKPPRGRYVVSGSGEFLAVEFLEREGVGLDLVVPLGQRLGPDVASAGPAFAVAKLATERELT